MKTWKSFLVVAILSGLCVFSCQVDDDEYCQKAETEVTSADLFVASESYQNFEKEIQKSIRKKMNAISRLSKEDVDLFQHLVKQTMNVETRLEAQRQLNVLLGYDEQAEQDRIAGVAVDVYKNVNISRLEFARTLQKRQMHYVTIRTRDNGTESFKECMRKCEQTAKDRLERCYQIFTNCFAGLSFEEKLYQTGGYKLCEAALTTCRVSCNESLLLCREKCIRLHTK